MKRKLSIFCILLCLVVILSFVLAACEETPHTHTFENYVCKDCGYDKLSDISWLDQTEFKDVGDKYDTVVKPLYDAAYAILQDLIASGDVNGELYWNAARNPRIVSIRFSYGTLIIITRMDIYVIESGEKSEFLQYEMGTVLENFGKNDEVRDAYENFLLAERRAQSNEDYVDLILPFAQRSASLILAEYERYKSSEDKEIDFHNYGKKIFLSADSSLSDTYAKIVANLNGTLAAKNLPLITDQDLNIGIGGVGFPAEEHVPLWIHIEATIGRLNYDFYLSFNEDGEYTQDYVNHFEGAETVGGGYKLGLDHTNPRNEEYLEFFNRLAIDKIDLSDIQDRYGYDGVGNALYGEEYGSYEITYLYF